LLNYVDITDSTLLERSLREKNEALEEADRLKSEFLANVSYELRSPLTTISGYSEMLEQDYFGKLDDKQKGHIRTIHEASQQLMNLIDDILDIASIEAGYMRLDVHYFDIENMLATVNMLVSDKARYSKLQVSIDCPPDIGSMLGDENRLRQVMFNLASNAIKYTPAGGTVTIGAESLRREGEDWVRIWVSDTGMGISPDEQEAVFNKFYRGAMARKHRSGTGLGLSMVKSFVELHGGSVELQSAAGQGTTVSCYLKRKNADLSLINPETEQRVLRDNLLH
jgi:signal transduction histidine kinase